MSVRMSAIGETTGLVNLSFSYFDPWAPSTHGPERTASSQEPRHSPGCEGLIDSSLQPRESCVSWGLGTFARESAMSNTPRSGRGASDAQRLQPLAEGIVEDCERQLAETPAMLERILANGRPNWGVVYL